MTAVTSTFTMATGSNFFHPSIMIWSKRNLGTVHRIWSCSQQKTTVRKTNLKICKIVTTAWGVLSLKCSQGIWYPPKNSVTIKTDTPTTAIYSANMNAPNRIPEYPKSIRQQFRIPLQVRQKGIVWFLQSWRQKRGQRPEVGWKFPIWQSGCQTSRYFVNPQSRWFALIHKPWRCQGVRCRWKHHRKAFERKHESPQQSKFAVGAGSS